MTTDHALSPEPPMPTPLSSDREILSAMMYAIYDVYRNSGEYDHTNRLMELANAAVVISGDSGEPTTGPLSAAQRAAVVANAGAIRYAVETVNGVLRELGVDTQPGGPADDISDRTEFDSVGDMLRAAGIGWPRPGGEAGDRD